MSKKMKIVCQLCLVIGSLGGLLSGTAQADALIDETLAELSIDAGQRFPNGVFFWNNLKKRLITMELK